MLDSTLTRTGSNMRPEGAVPQPGLVILYSEAVGNPPPIEVDGPVRVGRDPSLEFPLPDARVSRLQFRADPANDGLWITDTGSRNGTLANGVKVPGQLQVPFGSLILVGRTVIYVADDIHPFEAYPGRQEEPLIGGPALKPLREAVEIYGGATRPIPVLITGETGTGKERTASALHTQSGRGGELVPVNCAALPKDLIESELFGHTRGAFSGSDRQRQGLIRQADGGALFLDEVGELPLEAQAKLLRVLEEQVVRPVGSDRGHPVDLWVISATNRDLDGEVARGTFREDLLHRLAVGRIHLSALRERATDIPVLAPYLLRESGVELAADAVYTLCLHPWPGNVRELRNVLRIASEHARRLPDRPRIDQDLVLKLIQRPAPTAPPVSSGPVPLPPATPVSGPLPSAVTPSSTAFPVALNAEDAALRQQLIEALTAHRGRVSDVAKALGLRRQGLYKTFQRLGLDPGAFRS